MGQKCQIWPKIVAFLRCIAHNQFPPEVDAKPEQYELSLEQHLRVTSKLMIGGQLETLGASDHF